MESHQWPGERQGRGVMTFPGLSVIIPCYNQASSLPRAVESALAAGANEVVIVNDASTDNTAQVIQSLKRPQLVIATENHSGIPAGVVWARNAGIHMANRQMILPLDADDELLPDGIHLLARQIIPIVAIYGDYLIGDTLTPNAPPEMIYRKSVCHATALFYKEDWQRVGGYKSEFNVGCEDYEFLLSLADAGVRFIHVNAPVYRKAMNPNGRGAKCLERRPLIASLLKEYHPKVQL